MAAKGRWCELTEQQRPAAPSPSATAKITGQQFLKMKVGHRAPAISVGPRNLPLANGSCMAIDCIFWHHLLDSHSNLLEV
jgi:hypothetical protein